MNYNRLELLEAEKAELITWKQRLPFRDWHGVKPEVAEFRCFDTKRKASAYAKKHAPAAIYRA